MVKIYHFSDTKIPFIYSSISWAIEDLSKINSNIEVYTYTYDDLRYNKIKSDNNNCILFIEGGQTQNHHSGWTLPKFKRFFPNGKVILILSDSPYYAANKLPYQFGNENIKLIDFIIDFTPRYSKIWNEIGIPSTCFAWTISSRLYNQLREMAPLIDFTRKKTDFVCLANMKGPYREKLLAHLSSRGYEVEQGGSHEDRDLDATYGKFMNSWFSVGTTSHVRPELNVDPYRTLKGWRDGVAIALNCLLIYDNNPDIDKVWDIPLLPRFDFNNFDNIDDIYNWYKYDLVGYTKSLKIQQKWLSTHLLDKLILDNLKKYNIL